MITERHDVNPGFSAESSVVHQDLVGHFRRLVRRHYRQALFHTVCKNSHRDAL